MSHGLIHRFGSLRRRSLAGLSWRALSVSSHACVAVLAGAVLTAAPPRAQAYQFYSSGGLEMTLDTTLEYSNDFRLGQVSSTVSDKKLNLNSYNSNDGDQNFQHGLTSNRFQISPVLKITDGSFGIHISGEAYIDTAYLQHDQNGSAASVNYFVSDNKDLPRGTVAVDGREAELLDAFAYDSVSFGADQGQTITVKVGRSTLLWGQSLFFTGNGIAAGQAPVDINTALTLANPQASQVFLPVGQAVFTYQPNQWLTLQGYYQFEWRPDQFPGTGSFFSSVDFIGPGAQRLIVGETPFGPAYFSRAGDVKPGQNGQFGLSTQLQLGNYDIGFYGLRFDSKGPEFYLHTAALAPGASGIPIGSYQAVYNQDIQLYGASLSTTVGPVNVAGEVSGRIHQDLFSQPVIQTPAMNENSNPGYAYGDTLNAQASAIYLTPALPLMPGGASVLGEIEANRVLSVTNKPALVGGRTPDAVGLDVQITPTYCDVLPNLDVNIPIGVQWFPYGRSEFDSTMNAGTGNLDIGITASFKTVWQAGITYKDYMGSTSPSPVTGGSKQALADRQNLAFYIQRTF